MSKPTTTKVRVKLSNIVEDGMYLTRDQRIVIVKDGRAVCRYDTGGIGWLVAMLAEPITIS